MFSNHFYRPSASSGWWLRGLLSAAYLVNCWKHEKSLTFEYKYSSVIAFGTALQATAHYYELVVHKRIYRLMLNLVPAILTAISIYWYLGQGK